MPFKQFFLVVVITSAQFCWLQFTFAQANTTILTNQLRKVSGDIANLRNSTAQFLQGANRWFPAPQGDDADLINNLRDLQDRVQILNQDLYDADIQTLKLDMQSIDESASNIHDLLPNVGSNTEVSYDWQKIQNDLKAVRQTLQSMGNHNPSNE